jgi:hypothetical protein
MKQFSKGTISKKYNSIFKYGKGETLRLKIDIEDAPVSFFQATVTDHLLEEIGKDSYIPLYELKSSKGNYFTIYAEELSDRLVKVHRATEILSNSSDAEQDDEETLRWTSLQ